MRTENVPTAPEDAARPPAEVAGPADDRHAQRLQRMLLVGALVLALVATGILLSALTSGPPDPAPSGNVGSQDSAEAVADSEADGAWEARELATRTLTLWSAPDVPYREWWQGLRPLLTPGGREAYALTDPSSVPLLEDIEPSKVVMGAEGITATVYFSTSEGRFGVDVSRRDTAAPWLANRIVFPGERSMFR